MAREDVTLTTADGMRLASHWYPVDGARGWTLLLHMMPATKESFVTLAGALQERGIASLAFDQRGHGTSAGGPNGYEVFSDEAQQEKRRDVEAGVTFLTEQGMALHQLVIVGASIGANLAAEYAATHEEIPAVVLLSPGLNYRGVATEPAIQAFAPSQRALLATSGSDDAYSQESVERLAELLGDRATVRTFVHAGHGTTMFEREPGFLHDVVTWIVSTIANPSP